MTVERIELSVIVTSGPKRGSNLAFGGVRLSSDGRWLATARGKDVLGKPSWLAVTFVIPIVGLFVLGYLAFGPRGRHLLRPENA